MTTALPTAAEAIHAAADLGWSAAVDQLNRAAGDHARAAQSLRASGTASDGRQAAWHERQAAEIRKEAADSEPIRDGLVDVTGGLPPRRAAADPDSSRIIDNRDGARRAADEAIEWNTRSGLLADSGAETITRLLEQGDATSRSVAARWAAATGSEAYAGAFAKLAIDPTRGHMRWTAEEGAAFRQVETMRDENRALWSPVGSAGGYMVPISIDPTVLLTNDGVRSPIRSVARVEQITTDRWIGLTSAGVTSEWKAELAEANAVQPVIVQPQVPVYTDSTYCEYSVEVGLDAVNFLEQLSRIMLDASNTHVETAYATGTGIAQPQGLITGLVAAGGTTVVAPTTAEVFAAADVFKVQQSLGARWQANASWLSHLTWLNAIRQFETTAGALKFPEVENGRLVRRPINEWSLMDAVLPNSAVVDVNYGLAYGDWHSAFLIADRIGAAMEFIPVVVGANRRPLGARGAWLYRRTGSGVIAADAGRILSIPTA